MSGRLVAALPDGRLHLRDGPIDLVIGLDGTRAAMAEARARAGAAFDGLQAGLMAALPLLRAAVDAEPPPLPGRLGQRVGDAIRPFRREGITPLAAVAGAVAEEVVEAVATIPGLLAAHANTDGTIALFLAPGQVLQVGVAQTLMGTAPDRLLRIAAADPVRGVATCGWPGRRGIADAVTVLATAATQAAVAATVIADAVEAEHPAVRRAPAQSLDPGSDLGTLPVTVAVGDLPPDVIAAALDAGEAVAERLLQRGLILGALLRVKDESRAVGDPRLLPGC